MIPKSRRLDWFEQSRYGMFIHWGAYSVAGRGEWIMNRERIPAGEYTERYVRNWGAENYDPAAWCELAKEAGMGYVVLTTRHHDGFSLWETELSPFNAARMGPRRDLLAPYVQAARNAGLKVGFYYSPASWTHPDYPGAFFRDWPGEGDWADDAARRRFVAFYRGQLIELLSKYGEIDYLWFDGCGPANIGGDETLDLIRGLQPEILVNNRLGKPFDIHCCEQAIKPAPSGQAWEACMTLNDNWGYHAGDGKWKTSRDVVEMLLTCAQGGGNLLLNVGPMADGAIPAESISILKEAGQWVRRHRGAIACSDRHPFSWNCTARPITAQGNRVFLHFMKDPGGEFCWAEPANRVLAVCLLDGGAPIRFRQQDGRVFLEDLPKPLPDPICTSVEIELEGEPKALTSQTSFWIPG